MLSGFGDGKNFPVSSESTVILPVWSLYGDDELLVETLKIVQQQLCNPLHACTDVLHCKSSASSGYYQIQAANGSAMQIYCEMKGTHCGGEGGWMRVAHLNMTDPSSQCPVGFRAETANNTRFCIRDTSSAECGSMLFEPFGLTYSQVCGYVRGYSFASVDAFAGSYAGKSCNQPLSDNYVDGVSISYGNPPGHHYGHMPLE